MICLLTNTSYDCHQHLSSTSPTVVEAKRSSNAEAESYIPKSKNDEDKANTDADGNVADTSNTEKLGNTDGQSSPSVQNEPILFHLADDLANLHVNDDADGVDLDAGGDFDDFGDSS